ncbi:MAG: TolC family protein [Cyclobacteriaceae bacterium]|nr:TolC family protein [Cyclobacteriaceae bacterium]MDH4295962.1 TolC family protein [Cyclobacteriaceae bacterium]MDH5251119.1 TolC family protein [Cyclobacteriaceae bacterium]
MNKLLLVLLMLCGYLQGEAQNVLTITDIIDRSQSQSPDFKIAETRRENRYWQYRNFRSNYNPQVRLISNNAGALYNNSFSPILQPDGSIKYLQVNQLNPGINFALQQPVQWTGGTVSVNSIYNYFNNYVDNTSQWNGSTFNIRLSQPIFSYNQYKWDKRIQPIRYEESKRDYAESMEAIARDAVDNFFNVLQAQVDQQIALYNLANNDTIYKIEQGRYNIGTTSLDKLLQVELQLLRSRQEVAQAQLNLQTSSLELRTYIGLRTGESFDLKLPDEIPIIIVNEDDALKYARETRSAYIAFERRKAEAESIVAQAKSQRYNVNLTGGFGLNSVGANLGDLYQNPARQQFVNFTFNIPLLDWGRRRSMMQSAYANKRLTDYLITQDEVTFEQTILTQVRQFEMLKLQIEITKKADEVAFERYNVAQNRYLIGKIDITNLNIALKEKDDAKRSYIVALKSFWTAYFELRRLTLYDFARQKYLYNPIADSR